MVSPEILDYVKNELERGIAEDKLRHVLMDNGWPEYEVNEAFEKAKEKPIKEAVPTEEKDEKQSKEVTEEITEKHYLAEDIKTIFKNKSFITIAVIVLICSVAFFVLPSLFKGGSAENASDDIINEAKKTCTQYCNSNLCGLFINPGFPQPGLEGKNCLDFGVSCKQSDGSPKCETEY